MSVISIMQDHYSVIIFDLFSYGLFLLALFQLNYMMFSYGCSTFRVSFSNAMFGVVNFDLNLMNL